MRRPSRSWSWSLLGALAVVLAPSPAMLEASDGGSMPREEAPEAATASEPGNLGEVATQDPVLATFRGGGVLTSDVWREVRHLPQDERRYREVEGVPVNQQWRDWIRRVALRQLAQERAVELDLEIGPRLRERARQEVRTWWLNRWGADSYDLPLQLPSDEELVERVRGELAVWPARIQLSHIFLRAESEAEVERAVERLAAWRAELETLDAFRTKAREVSDSESARKDGKLGWLRKGWLPPSVEAVLYGLPEGTMSQPLPARGGVHLFWVEAKDPERTEPLEKRLARERERSRTLALHALRDQRAAEGPEIVIGEGAWPRVTVGEWTISGETLRAVHAKGVTPGLETAARVGRDEALLQRALSGGFLDDDEQARRRDLEANPMLAAVVEALVGDQVPQPSESAQRELYESRPDGFQTQILREIRLLKAPVPEGTDPIEFFRQLERVRSELASGRLDWAVAAERVEGGELLHWQPRPALEIASRTSPFLMKLIGPMAAGELSEVIQDRSDLYIVEVVSRQEPRRQSFEEVRPLLERELVSRADRRARARVIYQLLADSQFALTDEGEAFLAASPSPFEGIAEAPGDPGAGSPRQP